MKNSLFQKNINNAYGSVGIHNKTLHFNFSMMNLLNFTVLQYTKRESLPKIDLMHLLLFLTELNVQFYKRIFA